MWCPDRRRAEAESDHTVEAFPEASCAYIRSRLIDSCLHHPLLCQTTEGTMCRRTIPFTDSLPPDRS